MSFKERESSKGRQNDVLPSTSPTQFRSGAVIFAGELSEAADSISWWRMPELREFEAMAGHNLAAGYYGVEELMDTSSVERPHLCKILSD